MSDPLTVSFSAVDSSTVDLMALVATARIAYEYSQEALANHERNLGRTIERNRRLAEMIEADIATAKRVLAVLEEMEAYVETCGKGGAK